MARKKKEEHWAFAALRKRLTEETQTIRSSTNAYPDGKLREQTTIIIPDWQLGTIFLFDPELKREINGFFYETLYPQILAVFEKEPFAIPPIDKIELRENCGGEASCNALFIITDPKRPIHLEERPWWYIRFNLDVKAGYGYFLQTELILSIPFWLESDWMLDFVIGARHWGIPPTLGTDHDELTLKFSWGRGRYYAFSDEENAHFVEPFKKHLQIAKTVDRFSENPENRFLKSYMLQIITEFYGSH
jgi:hypothetical protein